MHNCITKKLQNCQLFIGCVCDRFDYIVMLFEVFYISKAVVLILFSVYFKEVSHVSGGWLERSSHVLAKLTEWLQLIFL